VNRIAVRIISQSKVASTRRVRESFVGQAASLPSYWLFLLRLAGWQPAPQKLSRLCVCRSLPCSKAARRHTARGSARGRERLGPAPRMSSRGFQHTFPGQSSDAATGVVGSPCAVRLANCAQPVVIASQSLRNGVSFMGVRSLVVLSSRRLPCALMLLRYQPAGL